MRPLRGRIENRMSITTNGNLFFACLYVIYIIYIDVFTLLNVGNVIFMAEPSLPLSNDNEGIVYEDNSDDDEDYVGIEQGKIE